MKKKILSIFTVFLMIAVVLFIERGGIWSASNQMKKAYVPRKHLITSDQAYKNIEETCLILTDKDNPASMEAKKEFQQIFRDMKIGCEYFEVTTLKEHEEIPFEDYETVVLLVSDMSKLRENVLRLTDWVNDGGQVMFAMALQREQYLMMIEQKIGIASAGYQYVEIKNVLPGANFMLGGGRIYQYDSGYPSSWAVDVSKTARIHMRTGDGRKMPLIWEQDYGKGTFVVCNIGLYRKEWRGFYASAYSLLTDCTVYPVINGSAFYLDDFPSPIANGESEYITRDYGVDLEEFYVNIWWPDMNTLAEKFGIRYTGVVVENYGDDTSGHVERSENVEHLQYFGNMLVHQGGEIGYHGYNHHPLVVHSFKNRDDYYYRTWSNRGAMRNGIRELTYYVEELFPTSPHSVYVPPANVLSDEGRALLVDEFPEIRTIASTYFGDGYSYEQEFEVAKDGIIEQPRVTSGCVMNESMHLAALSELNMHYVNNRYLHPDDVLDEPLGWKALKGKLMSDMYWLTESAPSLRQMTGSELSSAIQQFAATSIEKKRTASGYEFQIKNRYQNQNAYFFVRLQSGKPDQVTGGTMEALTNSLYLLCAKEDQVTVTIKE